MSRTTSPTGLALIQEFEGFRAEPAQIPDGAWVVGHGHVRFGAPGAPVTEAEAADLLEADLAPIEAAVGALVLVELSQCQFDALVSLATSIGVAAFAQSQVLRRVNAGAITAAAGAIDAWRKAEVDGEIVVVDALVRRRAAEKALFLKDAPYTAAPSVLLRAKLDYAAQVLGAPVTFAPTPSLTVAPVANVFADPAAGPIIAPAAPLGPAQRLTQILKSEPATEVLLLTQVAPASAMEEEGEIVTAHAKPSARSINAYPSIQRDRRIARMRWRAEFFVRINVMHTLETFGLAALFLFGVGLTVTGGSMFYQSQGDPVQVAGAAAFAAPGLAAILMAGFGMLRGPQPQAAQTAQA